MARRGVAAGRAPVVHEVAHQWWGNAVTERDWDDVWLSEGFATYFKKASGSQLSWFFDQWLHAAPIKGALPLGATKAVSRGSDQDPGRRHVVRDKTARMRDVDPQPSPPLISRVDQDGSSQQPDALVDADQPQA